MINEEYIRELLKDCLEIKASRKPFTNDIDIQLILKPSKDFYVSGGEDHVISECNIEIDDWRP